MYHSEVLCICNKLNPFSKEQNNFSFNSIINDTVIGTITREIENLINSLNLSQLISEPTNFEHNKNPSCIDLVITDQPNLVLDCRTRAS